MGQMLRVGVLAAIVMATTTGAWADDETPTQSPQEVEKARERAECTEQLKPLDKTVESDSRYAQGWRDAWLTVGAASISLALTAAFQNYGYRRAEGIVGAIQSSLLMIQKPDAVTSERALKGIRTAEDDDPCLAVANLRQILRANEDDWVQHTHWWNHVLAIGIPILVGAIVGVATNHFDYATNGNEGAIMTVGVVLGELQVLTFPRPSVRVDGPTTHAPVQMGVNSLTLHF